MEIIVTHVSSDFDSFAGMIAAKMIHPEAKILLPSSINQNVRRFIALYEDELPAIIEPGEIDFKKVKKVIIIDTKIPSRLGPVKEVVKNKKTEIVIYDHHQKSEEDIGRGFDFTEVVGASTTILVNIIRKRHINISPFEATLFSLGIYEDTGSFSFPNTSYKDFRAAAFLKRKGANSFVISRFLNLSLTDEQHILLENLISNMRKLNVNGKEIIISYAKNKRFVEGLSVLTRKLAQVEDIDIVFCWVRMKDKIYVVARSDDPEVNVSKVLNVIGGGGHSQAASAVLKDMDYTVIEKKITAALSRNIKKPITARAIMSYPVKVVNEDESIKKVNDKLKKYGHSGIPIVSSTNSLAGIITRKDTDKAIKHGLSHAPVKGFKSHGIITTGPEATIDEIQRMMIENAIGRIPIMEKGRIVGIVTRKDILRSLHDKGHLKYPEKFRSKYDFDFTDSEVRERIHYLFPSKITGILDLAAGVAGQLGVKAYLIGGIVRDLLLGIPNFDIDIVVEGDGIKFAKKLSEMIPARVESHDKFKTAVLIMDDDRHIDVASSRVEYYERPAALPSVEPGSIRQDLARRDFTINTLALSLHKDNFGEILDFFGGRKDLAARVVKILHKLSFIEDPTRIFRAVRFEQRLDFKMDNLTEKLARSTLDMKLFSKLAGIRIRDEMVTILEEKEPWKAIKRLHDLDALRRIGLDIHMDVKFIKSIRSALTKRSVLSFYLSSDFKQWRMLLIILMLDKKIGVIRKWCSEMKVKKKDTEIILKSVSGYKALRSKISRKISKNSNLYRLLHDIPEELLVILSSRGKNHLENIKKYLSQLEPLKLEITGNDLKSLSFKPSRNFKIVLSKLMEMRLDGSITTKEEQLAVAGKILSRLDRT
jgi:tRNA nucleotidyltransferase (CCA-adding enzyme)